MRRQANYSHVPLVSSPRTPTLGQWSHSFSFPPTCRLPEDDPKSQATLTLFLIQRQQLFREAALHRKQMGDLENAKMHLLQSKGFDLMISACTAGYPITLSGIPPLPTEIVCDFAPITPLGSDFYNLECEFLNQSRICGELIEHFLRADKATALLEVFSLSLGCAEDLAVVREAYESGMEMPPSEYVLKALPSLQVCKDVGSREIEVKVHKAFNFKPGRNRLAPKSYYVNIFYPFPQIKGALAQTPRFPGGESSTLLDFSTRFIFSRHSPSVKDRIRSESLKFDVFRRSLFGKSKFVGRSELKLAELQTSCVLHDILDVKKPEKGIKMDKNRIQDRSRNKPEKTGSMIEVSARIRYPLGSDSAEHSTEIKWLVVRR